MSEKYTEITHLKIIETPHRDTRDFKAYRIYAIGGHDSGLRLEIDANSPFYNTDIDGELVLYQTKKPQ